MYNFNTAVMAKGIINDLIKDIEAEMKISGKVFEGTATFSQGALPFEGKKIK